MQAGFGGLGARVSQFVLLDGQPGPLEQQGVGLGMYLVRSGSTDLGDVNFADVMEVLHLCRNAPRELEFNTRPTDAAIRYAVLEAFGDKNPQAVRARAAKLLQRRVR